MSSRKKSIERSLKKGIVFKEDMGDKENENRIVNFSDIQHGLQSGVIEYNDLKFDPLVLNKIKFKDGKSKKKRGSVKDRSFRREGKKTGSSR